MRRWLESFFLFYWESPNARPHFFAHVLYWWIAIEFAPCLHKPRRSIPRCILVSWDTSTALHIPSNELLVHTYCWHFVVRSLHYPLPCLTRSSILVAWMGFGTLRVRKSFLFSIVKWPQVCLSYYSFRTICNSHPYLGFIARELQSNFTPASIGIAIPHPSSSWRPAFILLS